MELQDVFTFSQSDLQSTSFAAFEVMRNKGELCDLKITAESHSFSAHRVVVAAAIPYFRNLFTDDGAESNEIIVGVVDPVALESLIDFAYSGKIHFSNQNVHSLLLASQILQLNNVRDACVQFLSKKLSDSVAHPRILERKLDNLTENSKYQMLKNFTEFCKSSDFLNLPSSSIKEIISEEDLNVSNEEIVFEAMMRWVKNLTYERNVMLAELLSEVRMIYLSKDYLIKIVESEELIRNSIPCRDLISEVKNYHLLPNEKSTFSNLKMLPRKCIDAIRGLYAVHFGSNAFSVYRLDDARKTWHSLGYKESNQNLRHVVAVNEKLYLFCNHRIVTFNVRTLEWEEDVESDRLRVEDTSIVLHGSMIYCFGFGYDDVVRCFDTKLNKWTKQDKMREHRCYPAVSALEEFIYLTGGLMRGFMRRDIVGSCEKYDPSSGQWSEICPMHHKRSYHCSTTLNKKIYVCGGRNNMGNYLRSMEMYDPLSDQWTLVSSMRVGGRIQFSLPSYKGKIYMIDRLSEELMPSIEIFDPDRNEWEPIKMRLSSALKSVVAIDP